MIDEKDSKVLVIIAMTLWCFFATVTTIKFFLSEGMIHSTEWQCTEVDLNELECVNWRRR